MASIALAPLLSVSAAAQVLASATRTIFLARGDTGHSPTGIAYHPGFARYYGSDLGTRGYPAFVFDASGTLLQTQTPLDIDARAWNYNANTGQLEVVSYDALHGGVGRGLIRPGVTDAGALTGATSELLASLPGLINEQTMPAYDSAANVFYSWSGGSKVNVVSRVDGALVSTIDLDLAAAGNPKLTFYALGFDPGNQWLIVVSRSPANRAHLFELDGAYVGSSQLDVSVESNYQMGFANGQLFVFDEARQGWQGYAIGNRPPPANYQGLWWKAPAGSEAGWGINFAHQGDVIFATWFTYDASGKPWWLIALLDKAGPGIYSGPVSTVTGPPFNADPFDPNAVAEVVVGSMAVNFASPDSATLEYTVNGMAQTKAIVPQEFGPRPACVWGGGADVALATNFQDLWWRAPPGLESGWGVNLTHQGDVIFATWFTYDANGNPWWLIAEMHKVAPSVYTGAVWTVTGPPFNAVPFDPNLVIETGVGAATVAFTDGNNGTFDYTVNGIKQIKPITRQVFVPPGTVCQ